MRLTCDLHALTAAATAASQAVRENKDFPALNCLKLSTDGDRLTVLGYDRETWVRMVVAAVQVDEPGCCLVPARDFLSWLRASPPGKVSVHADHQQIRLERGGRAFLPSRSVAEFPEPDPTRVLVKVAKPHGEFDEQEVESDHLCDVHLPCSTVLAAFARVLMCCEKKESSKFVTRGVLVEVGDGELTMCGTDNRHVAHTTVETARPASDGKIHEAIVPREAAFKLAAVVGAESEITLSVSDHSVVFRGDRSELGTRLLDGKFPPFRRFADLANRDDGTKIEVPTVALMSAVSQATAVTAEGDQKGRIEIAFCDREVRLCCPGSSVVEMPAAGANHPHVVTMYAPDLLDFLRVAVAQGSRAVAFYPANRARGPWLLRALPAWDYYPPLMTQPKTEEPK